jgi:nitronate monooxygenase
MPSCMSVLDRLALPIVQAPMAGGPSTPALAAAVSDAGGLGFLAAGYKTADAVRDDVAATRALTEAPIGVNLFAPGGEPADPGAVARYADRLRPEAEAAGVELGPPRFDDDAWHDKLELLCGAGRVTVVSCTFGCPDRDVVARLQAAGSEVWVTVTSVAEAEVAVTAGADALIAQGVEAGGHRGFFTDEEAAAPGLGVLALLQVLRDRVGLPLVATGGIVTGAAVGAALVAGAEAAQLGTAYLLCPEAATSAPHRAAVATDRPTAPTRVFSGRLARGIVNRFMIDHEAHAPLAYPEVHHITSPLRAHGRATGDGDVLNLWAGQAHALAQERPAGELTRTLAADARAAVAAAQARLGPSTGGAGNRT